MIALLLLGIIPGTNIQISFTNWLVGTALFAMLLLLYLAQRRRLPLSLIIAVAIVSATWQAKSKLLSMRSA